VLDEITYPLIYGWLPLEPVLQALADHGAFDRGLKVRTLVLPDVFQDQDKPDVMYAQAGLDAEGIMRGALRALGMDNMGVAGRRA